MSKLKDPTTNEPANLNLWRGLGVDIAKHDQLNEALARVYAETFAAETARPEAMDYFHGGVTAMLNGAGRRLGEIIDRQSRGDKVIGAFCAFFPEELVLAVDGIPLIVCGGAEYPISEAENVLPAATCPLIKSSFGLRTGGICPFFMATDLFVGETTCGGKKKMYELLEKHSPMHVLHLPHKKDDDSARRLWLNEVRNFKRKLEQITGRRITGARLQATIKRNNAKRLALQRLAATRKNEPPPIWGRDVLLVIQLGAFDDPDRFTERVNCLALELEERAAAGRGVVPAKTPRILVSGTPMPLFNWKIHNIIERSGAVVVAEESCTGTRYFNELVDEDEASLQKQMESLAERYLKINCACFTPNPRRAEQIVELAKEYQADGVVYNVLQFCHEFNIEFTLVQEALKAAGIPVLKIESDFSSSDTGQLRTRVEAFLETLAVAGLSST